MCETQTFVNHNVRFAIVHGVILLLVLQSRIRSSSAQILLSNVSSRMERVACAYMRNVSSLVKPEKRRFATKDKVDSNREAKLRNGVFAMQLQISELLVGTIETNQRTEMVVLEAKTLASENHHLRQLTLDATIRRLCVV